MVKKEIKVEVIYTDGWKDRFAKACAEVAKRKINTGGNKYAVSSNL